MFNRFDRIRKRDRHTDRQTLHDGTRYTCIASHGKQCFNNVQVFTTSRGTNYREISDVHVDTLYVTTK